MQITIINDEYVEQIFKKIAEEIISENQEGDREDSNLSFILEGICGEDVSEIDETNLSSENSRKFIIDTNNLSLENFKRLTFDGKTKFSERQKEKFHPEQLLKQGKFSEDMKELHNAGIDGEGTTIGIIDSCFNIAIPEFEGRVEGHRVFEKIKDKNGKEIILNRHYEAKDGDGFHGKTTASLVAGKTCGIAPKARIYLFGIAEDTPYPEAKEAILEYIKNNNIKLDIISMSADTKNSKKAKDILEKLEEEGCTFLDSSKFWKDFVWGRTSQDGKTVLLDELMKTMSKMEVDENSKGGKVIKNMKNTAILPCTGRTSLQIGKEEVDKYNGSVCGASFAIPQVAGLFLLAKQRNPSISYDEFIEIIKNPERLNPEQMMYVEPKEILKAKSLKSTQKLGRETLEEQEDTSGKLIVMQDIGQQKRDLENEQEKN